MQRFLSRQISPFLRSGPPPTSSKLTSSKFTRLLPFVEQTSQERHRAEVDEHKQLIQSLVNTPIFTPAAEKYVDSRILQEDLPQGTNLNLIPQYGLVGICHDDAASRRHDDDDGAVDTPLEDRLVLANYNMPWSAFICGSQGAGKSHTLSCMLENLLSSSPAGELPHPLAGLVMHFDNYTNSNTTQLCESAYLCSSGIPVKVLVSPSNIWAMKRQYANLPGLPPGSPLPKVYPLYLSDHHMTITRMLKLMAYNPAANDGPLYMEVVMSIIRDMAMEGPAFDYERFRHQLEMQRWDKAQHSALNLRLKLLDGFMAPSDDNSLTPRPAAAEEDIWTFEPGTLTIVDLSDPFVSSDSACTLFSIALSIFLEHRHKCGRVVAMDEAHKFLSQSGEARILTQDLTSIIRQQRHTGTRVLIATQEPTLGPELIDLANATFVHRFLSPAWYNVLSKHLAGASKMDNNRPGSLFDTIVKLRTGEALLFCPTAQIDVDESKPMPLTPLGNDYLKIKIRRRVTADGGKSIMASDATVDLFAELAAQKARQDMEAAAGGPKGSSDGMGVPMFKPLAVRQEEIRAARWEFETKRRVELAKAEQEQRAKKKAARARQAAERAVAKKKKRDELEAMVARHRREGRRIYGEFYWEDALRGEQRLALDGSRPFADDPADYESFEEMTREEIHDLSMATMNSDKYDALLREEEEEYIKNVLRENTSRMDADTVRENFMLGEDESSASVHGNEGGDDSGLGFGDDDQGDDNDDDDDDDNNDDHYSNDGDDDGDDDNDDYDDGDDDDDQHSKDGDDGDDDDVLKLSLSDDGKPPAHIPREVGLAPITLPVKKAGKLHRTKSGEYVTRQELVNTAQQLFHDWWALNRIRMPLKKDYTKIYEALDQILGTRVANDKKFVVELNGIMQSHMYKFLREIKDLKRGRRKPPPKKKKKVKQKKAETMKIWEMGEKEW